MRAAHRSARAARTAAGRACRRGGRRVGVTQQDEGGGEQQPRRAEHEPEPVGEAGGGQRAAQLRRTVVQPRPGIGPSRSSATGSAGSRRAVAPGLEGDREDFGAVRRVQRTALREDQRHEHQAPLPRRVLRLVVLGPFAYRPLPAAPRLESAEQRFDPLGGDGPRPRLGSVLDEAAHGRPVRLDPPLLSRPRTRRRAPRRSPAGPSDTAGRRAGRPSPGSRPSPARGRTPHRWSAAGRAPRGRRPCRRDGAAGRRDLVRPLGDQRAQRYGPVRSSSRNTSRACPAHSWYGGEGAGAAERGGSSRRRPAGG